MLRGQRDRDCRVSRGFADTVSKNVGAGAAQAAAASRHPTAFARTPYPLALPCLRSPHIARQFSQEKSPRAEGAKRARAAGQVYFRHQPEYVPHTPIR